MKLTVILLLFLWDNVEFTLTLQECSELPSFERAFVLDEYKKAEYQKGDVIYFCCEPGYTTGLNTTYICTERGWRAATIGHCVEDTFPVLLGCTPPPPLTNGVVLKKSTLIFENGQTVQYRCHDFHTMRGGPFKTCTNGQWTGDVQCIAVPCKLSLKPPVGTTYEPQSQMSFTPGQSVRVTCGDDQWVKNTELQTADLICQDTGEWDFDPVCKRVTCQKTADHVYRWERKYESYWRIEKYHGDLGETLWYQCYQEYEETSVRATCTRRGWEPKTLCKEKRCTKPSYTNADITDSQYDKYNHNDRVTLECTYDKPTVSFSVDCNYGEWRGRVPSCKEKPCATKPSITNGEMLDDQTQRTEYDHGQSLKFRCNGETEPFTVTCQSGLWEKEKSCEDVPCRTKPIITNARMLSRKSPPYNHGRSVRLRCTGTDETFSVTCQSGEWMPKHQCREQGACGKAEIANRFSHESQNRLYYTCSPGFKLLSKGWWADASCVDGEWTTQDCVANTDCGPVPEIPNLNATYIGQRFSEGYFIPIQCETGYHNLNVNLTKVTCRNGAWSSNRVDFKRICTSIVQPCNPPPKVRNAVILAPFKKTYPSGTVLTYTCKNDYTLSVEDATVQCNDGSWEQKSIRCIAPSDRELAAKPVVN